jgi:cellulose synthase/poly-beta-1,6-N-acetylglucosamine synthase-like glycosyltransferase
MNIGRLLNNILCEQELPADSEVFVVSSGCTDNTIEIVNKYAKLDSRVRTYVENERKGKASAVNRILSDARGHTILLISADTLPSKGCFSKLLTKLQLPNVGIVCGNPIPTNRSTALVDKIVQLLWGFHGHLARHATEIFCIRKGIVDKIPTETVNDDAYVALIAKKKGWTIKYESKSSVSICGPKTFIDYFRQRRRVLFGHHQVKKLTGEAPQHLLSLLTLHPIRVVKLLLWFFAMLSLPTILAFVLTELAINATATVDSILGKTHFKWRVSSSTKMVTQA